MTLLFQIKNTDRPLSFQALPFLSCLRMGGNRETCDIPLSGCPADVTVRCEWQQDAFTLTLENAGAFEHTHATACTFEKGQKAAVHVAHNGKRLFSLEVQAVYEETAPRYDRSIRVDMNQEITVGSQENADILLFHPLISGPAFTLRRANAGLTITPGPRVPMGVFVNTSKITGPTQLNDGDFISCPGLRANWHEGRLLVPSMDNLQIQTLLYTDEKEKGSHLTYPYISRTTRKRLERKTEQIEVLDPPPALQNGKSNLFISLLPALFMVLITLFLRGNFSSDGSMILFSVASLSVGAVTSVITYLHTNKENRAKETQRQTGYRQYMQELEDSVRQMRAEERDNLQALYIHPDRQYQNVMDFSADLFDRHVSDDDFLDIRLGYGTLRSARKLVCKKHEVFETADPLAHLPKKLVEKYTFIDDMPAWVPARNANALGIVGDVEKLQQMVKIMTLDLATHHYFDDMRLYYFLGDAFRTEVESFRFLPHLKNEALGRRNIACNEESQKILVEDLFKTLSDRESMDTLPENMPWLVVFVYADASSLLHHPIIKFAENASRLHAVFIFLTQHRDLLPSGCAWRIDLFSNVYSGVISSMLTPDFDQLFSYEPLSNHVMNDVALRLAPVCSGDVSLATRLSTSETLFGMLGITGMQEMDILKSWQSADTSVSLAAPMGAADGGGVLSLDPHESVHGPHGLVAGTTGSGKSQVLISYILALASRFSPEDVAFCIIDFKGGDIVKHLAGLPHIVGSITNLEKHEITRSLKSINAEKNKRMRLFADPEVNVSNISSYTRAYKAGKAKIPLPHLIIIVDEFAELKSQHPDFMNDLISIARVGRSLGIHMILCTQKPAGVVDGQIWGNSDFKLCLRVQTKEDSNEVLKSPLASQIREPGRGYLQVGRTNEFVLFQSGYSGASEFSNLQKDQAFAIHRLDLSGKKEEIFRHSPPVASTANRTQCDALLAGIIDAFDRSGLQPPEKLCLPPVPAWLPYEQAPCSQPYTLPIGVYDDPDAQQIHPLDLKLCGRNTLIVGSSQMGKTNLLMVMLRRMAETMTPADAQVYVMDFNALALKTMESLSIIGGVVTTDEEEKLKNLIKLLRDEMQKRKTMLMEAGTTTFLAYRETRQDLPAIVVMIDNYATFKELYEEKYGDDMTFLLREGPAMGISFFVTAQQTAALSYRKLYYFAKRFALPLSEQNEYSSVLEGCRMALPETPGRVLMMRAKQFYEGQVYEAFSGETEAEKAAAIRLFVAEHSAGPRARQIPNVPTFLTAAFLRSTMAQAPAPGMYAYGMSYANVAPVFANLNHQFCWALTGNDERGKHRFLHFFLQNALEMAQLGQANLCILDDYQRRLKEYALHPATSVYITDPEETDSLFSEITTLLEDRLAKARLSEDGQPEGPTIIVVVNSPEIIRYISDSSLLMDQFNTMAEKYWRMKIFFLFSCMENKSISYSSPELLRYLRDKRQALLFDELGSIKPFDISLMVQRANARPRMNNEAFLLSEEEVTRIKLLDALEPSAT